MKYEFGNAIAEGQSESGALVATVSALYWQDGDLWQHLNWYEIARATWSSESGAFRVEPVNAPVREWKISQPGRLPETARERITSTIIAQDVISVPGKGKVTVIFRQAEGQILVQLRPPMDPALIADQIRAVQGELGIG